MKQLGIDVAMELAPLVFLNGPSSDRSADPSFPDMASRLGEGLVAFRVIFDAGQGMRGRGVTVTSLERESSVPQRLFMLISAGNRHILAGHGI